MNTYLSLRSGVWAGGGRQVQFGWKGGPVLQRARSSGPILPRILGMCGGLWGNCLGGDVGCCGRAASGCPAPEELLQSSLA